MYINVSKFHSKRQLKKEHPTGDAPFLYNQFKLAVFWEVFDCSYLPKIGEPLKTKRRAVCLGSS